MTTDTKKDIIAILQQARGDDAARARNAFKGMTIEQMKKQHGESGKTRQQILDEYERHDAKIERLIQEVKAETP